MKNKPQPAMKRDLKQWAQMFSRRWAELFAALTNTEQREIMDYPDGWQAQALSRKAGDFADDCLSRPEICSNDDH